MSPSYLRIYLILVLSIMTQVKYGILQLDGTTEAFPSQKNETITEAFHLQFNGTIETFPSPLNGTTEAPPLNGTISETFHLQLNGKTEKFPSPLDPTTEAFPSRHGTPGTTEPLDTTTEAFSWYMPSENSTFCSCEDFEKRGSAGCRRDKDFYLSVKNAPVTMTGSTRFRFKSLVIKERQVALDGLQGVLVLEEMKVQRSGFQLTPGTTKPLDTMRGVIFWWPDSKHVPSENCTFQFLFCEDFPKLGTVWCCGYETYLFSDHWLYALPVAESSTFRIKCLRINDPQVALDKPSLGGVLVVKEFKVKRSGLQVMGWLFLGTPLFRIGRVILDGNQLRNLSTILRRYRVVEFRASRNRLEALYGEDFSTVHDTVDLNLRDNKIRQIDPEAFQPIRKNLQRLDLSCNSIPHLNGSVRYLSELKTLNVSCNKIQLFSQDEFAGLHQLSELYLQHNRIRVLAQLQHLTGMLKLDISHNHLQIIRPQQLPPALLPGTVIYLGDNPFKCDCRLQPLIDWARGRDKERDFAAISPELCLRSDLGNRTWESEECLDLCTCSCRDDFMFVDCSSKSLIAVPQFLRKVEGNKTVDSDVVMRQNRIPSRHFEGRVGGINLENNSLESLEGVRLPLNLTLLYLAHNKLRRLPEALLDYSLGLKRMSLAGNPWRCDCSTVTFMKWLTSNNGIFRDLDAIRCGPDEKESVAGKAVSQLTDLDLCPSTTNRIIVSVAFGILTLIIVCLSAKLLFARYELNIRVFLYNHGLTFAREEDIDQDKVFDVFVSFSHTDDEFVIRDIIPVIERDDPDIRLCLHYRHFMAGEFILDNITRAVHSSRRTLLILTRNFLESEWCLQEFRTAHRQSMEDKVHRIVAVKVGDLPPKIDPTLQVYLDCTTYLVWDEVNFWNKLLFVLPTRNAGKNKTVVEDCPDL